MNKKRFAALCGVILVTVIAFILSLARAPENAVPNLIEARAPIERQATPVVLPTPVATPLTPTTNTALTLANAAPNRLQDAVAPPPMQPILPPDMPDPARPPQGTQPLAVPEPPVAPDPFVLPAIAVDEHVRYTRGTPVPADLYAPPPAEPTPQN